MAGARSTPPWRMLSITSGNALQLAGLLTGGWLLRRALHARPSRQTRLLLAGWLATYFCNHAIAHWAVGRLVGIRFVGYGVHGTTAPQWYPPGLRWLFMHLPLLSARVEPASLRAASPLARLAMYLAGPLLTLATGLGLPLYAWRRGLPGAGRLLAGAGLWFTPMLVVEALRAGGDLRRAARELQRLLRGG